MRSARAAACIAAILCVAPPVLADDAASPEKPVYVRVNGVTPAESAVRISVYDGEAAFLEVPRVKMQTRAKSGVAEFEVRGLAPGEYAFAVYVDVNEDGVLNRGGVLGRPTEPVVFSGNIVPRFRRPQYEEARVDFVAGGVIEVVFPK